MRTRNQFAQDAIQAHIETCDGCDIKLVDVIDLRSIVVVDMCDHGVSLMETDGECAKCEEIEFDQMLARLGS